MFPCMTEEKNFRVVRVGKSVLMMVEDKGKGESREASKIVN